MSVACFPPNNTLRIKGATRQRRLELRLRDLGKISYGFRVQVWRRRFFSMPMPTAAANRGGSVPVKVAEHPVRREDIDGLRAIACLMVVLFHMDSSWLPGGYMGVDVFFVISGYIVTLSLSRAWRSKRASPLACCASFYARRICRLSPLVLATVVVTALAMSVFVQARDGVGAVAVAGLEVPTDAESLQGFYVTGLFALFGGANVWLATQGSGGYWGHGRASAEWNPFTHFWSLGVEEQFYLAFPPIYLAIQCLGDRRPRAAAGVVAFLCVGSVALSLALQTKTPNRGREPRLLPHAEPRVGADVWSLP